MTQAAKIDASFNKVARIQDLDDLAAALFPGNRRHQHAFAAMFFVLKWSDGVVADLRRCVLAHGVSKRVFERSRAKMRRLGLIDHVSRFNQRHGYREGWVLSNRFETSMESLIRRVQDLKATTGENRREKDRFAVELLGARSMTDDDNDGAAAHHGMASQWH